MNRAFPAVLLVATLGVRDATAQWLPPTETPLLQSSPSESSFLVPRPTGAAQAPGGPAPSAVDQVCAGCPPRRLGTAFLQVTYVNVLYELANLARGQVTAHITPETWWTNMKRGWEWDLDDFAVNQIGHPYQGNNYFNAGRANGLSFWESAGLTAFGSGTWEYFGETNQASLNDFINTTLGGIALGEMFHRAAWLVRDTHATGRGRLWREIAATAIDPLTGYNRFRSGDAKRIGDPPPDLKPTTLDSVTSVGVVWRDSNSSDVDSTTAPFFETDVLYGNLEAGRSRVPYDAFAVRLTFGGGSAFSEARVRGRLIGRPLNDGRVQLSILQGYQYNKNDAYQFGAQSFDVDAGIVRGLTSRTSLWATAWGGLTILGAVDSIPPPGSAVPTPEEDAGQGVSTGPRFYDYGPGANFGGFVNFKRDSHDLLQLSYEAHQLHVLDGVRANHLLQRARAELIVPVRGRLGVGLTGEFFDRRTYFQDPAVEDAHFHFPQFRVAMTWSSL
jgi:uncharacterized protein DUF3943